MHDIGKLIQTARVSKGLTAKQLAKQCGVAESNIIDIEGGRKIASEALLKRFAKLLAVDLNIDFADLADQEPPARQKNIKIDAGSRAEKKDKTEKPVEQWEMAFGNILRKIPVYDLETWQVVEQRLQPVTNNKIDGVAPDKLIFVRMRGDALLGLGVKNGDLLKVALARDITHNGIHLLRMGGRLYLRRTRKMDGEKVLLMDFDRDSKTEIRTVKEIETVGRCLAAEILL